MKKNVYLLGIPFEPLSCRAARKRIVQLIRANGSARKIYTPNASILYRTYGDPSLSRLLRRADLLLPDGAGVILASRMGKHPLPERITGIDTAEWLLRYGEKHGLSFYFLGGKPGVAEIAAKRWKKRLPHLRIVGTHHGYFQKSGQENRRLLAKIQTARPDILFVCFGFPEQEKWIDRYTASIPSLRLSIGLGGALDVWSGRVKRAPKIVQQTGLEWLWRAAREPKRLKDLSILPKFLITAKRLARSGNTE